MAHILIQRATKEEMIAKRKAFRKTRWPYSENPIKCPDCETVFTIDPDEDEQGAGREELSKDRVQVYGLLGDAKGHEAFIKCPSCDDEWNIRLVECFAGKVADDYLANSPSWRLISKSGDVHQEGTGDGATKAMYVKVWS